MLVRLGGSLQNGGQGPASPLRAETADTTRGFDEVGAPPSREAVFGSAGLQHPSRLGQAALLYVIVS